MMELQETVPSHEKSRAGVSRNGRTTSAVVVGLAFFWQFFRHANLKSVVAEASIGFDAGFAPLTFVFYGAALVFAFFLLARRSLPARLSSSRITIAAGALASIGFLFAWMNKVWSVKSGLVSFVAFVLAACGFVVLTLGWARRCCAAARADRKHTVFVLCVSSLASFAVAFLFSLFPNGLALLTVLTPILSALCINYACLDDVEQRSDSDERVSFVPRPMVIVLVSLLALIVCMKGVSDAFYASESDAMLYLKHFITTIELVIIIFVCLFATNMSKFAFAGWAVLAGGVLSGLAFLFFPGESSAMFQFGLGTVTAGRTCLELFVFIVATCLSARDELRTILLLLVLPDMAGCLIGYGVLPFALEMVGVSGADWFGALSLGACAIVVVSTFLAMSFLALKGLEGFELRQNTSADVGEVVGDDRHRFDAVAQRFELTKREAETVYLFYKGYSTKRIAELHYVSLNTTQSHLRSAYRKLGVHNRQQLIDLVDSKQNE